MGNVCTHIHPYSDVFTPIHPFNIMAININVHKKKKKLLTDINMVPFIDVVLVLLIIFMVLSPFLVQSEIPINLPKAVSHKSLENDNPIIIQITKNGDYYLQSKRILRKNIQKNLSALLSKSPEKAVLIEADRDVSFKNVVVALDASEQVKAAKVGVGVLRIDPAEKEK